MLCYDYGLCMEHRVLNSTVAAAGLPTVDVGAPQFAMHSIREVAGCDDVITKVRIMRSAYQNYTEVDQTFCHTCSM